MKRIFSIISFVICGVSLVLMFLFKEYNLLFAIGFIVFALLALGLYLYDDSTNEKKSNPTPHNNDAKNNNSSQDNCNRSELSLIEKVQKAGGNFAFIAQNVAIIYYIIENSEEGKNFSLEEKVYATCIIDLITYLKLKQISIETCRYIANYTIKDYEEVNRASSFDKRVSLISTLSIYIETVIFSIDTDYPSDVLNPIVLSNKGIIENMVNKTLIEGEKCDIYNTAYSLVMKVFKNKENIDILKDYNG